MAQDIKQFETTKMGNESAGGSSNNLYQKGFEKSVSNDNVANGMGIARPSTLKSFENVAGSEASEQYMLKEREIARFDELKRKALGNPTITNAGIILDSFGGAFGEGRKGIDTMGESKEQSYQ